MLTDLALYCVREFTLIPFVKAHASENDFLILDEGAVKRGHSALAKKLCARHSGIGADGIEYLDRRGNHDLFLRLFNSDGSEAELSGNGTRCVAAWLASSEGRTKTSFRTHAGVRTCKVLSSCGACYEIESSMGLPQVSASRIDLPGVGFVDGAIVNMGNPHFVVRTGTNDFSSHGLSWQALGEQISMSALFPHGTNVEFVRVVSNEEIEFRIYERGCGPTKSSGTGTCASAAAAVALYGAARELKAIAEGGSQRVVWPSSDEQMLLTGSAEIICTGEAFL